jgi:hypothetical protein
MLDVRKVFNTNVQFQSFTTTNSSSTIGAIIYVTCLLNPPQRISVVCIGEIDSLVGRNIVFPFSIPKSKIKSYIHEDNQKYELR